MILNIQNGDFVKGLPGSPYGITNESMTRGVVTKVDGEQILVKVLNHLYGNLGHFAVDPKYFEVIGHAKPFNRDEVIELLKNGCKKAILDYDLSVANLRGADLRGANLRDANLSGADLDFSCWPLWCGSLKAKTDKRLACQLAYHLCSMQCDDAEYINMRNSILAFANQFHRVDECGTLKLIELPAQAVSDE